MAYLALVTIWQYIPTFHHPKWRIWDMDNRDWLTCEGIPIEFESGDEAYAFLKEMEDFR